MAKSQARLRVIDGGRVDEPRTCAQSAPGQSSSQVTSPRDSRSMAIASDSEHVRDPYATLRRCPYVVPHLSANDSRSASSMGWRNSLSSMPTECHRTVTVLSTPIVEFTKWLHPSENDGMQTDAHIRRENLARLIRLHFNDNKSEIARAYNPEDPKPSYFSDLLREGSGKSFGEKAARRIEERVGLLPKQLDIPNSPLTMDDTKRNRVKDELRAALDDLNKDEMREALDAIRKIQSRRGDRRKAV